MLLNFISADFLTEGTDKYMLGFSRQLWVVFHRWAGLTMAFFLIVAGLTGAILPFEEELTLLSRPQLSSAAPPVEGTMPLDAVTLAERVTEATGGRIEFLPLQVATDHIFSVSVASRDGNPPLSYNTVWVDPYSGAIKLKFRYGALSDGPQNIVPFIYELHYSLALGDWGTSALGLASLIWTLDCVVGFYLTLPIRKKKTAIKIPGAKSWFSRWRPAWTLRKGVRGHKLNFDLHRAGGLWLWPLLFVFAWSGVGFNLLSVHEPIMKVLGATEYSEPFGSPSSQSIGFKQASLIGLNLMQEEARRQGFSIERPGYLLYRNDSGTYRYSARTSLDAAHDDPQTILWFSGTDGSFLRFDPPLGKTLADKTMKWFYMLHMGQVFGLPYRIFVSVLGVAVAVLSVTGILIWMKKRSAKILGKQRAMKNHVVSQAAAE